jgi:hypothetical protein
MSFPYFTGGTDMTRPVGTFSPTPGIVAPPNSPRRPEDPNESIAEVAVLPAHWTVPESALEKAVKRGDYKATEEYLAISSDLGIAVDVDWLLWLAIDHNLSRWSHRC